MPAREAHILTLTADNEFGVLTRITAQIRREGWNIKSLSAEETADPSISRITLALQCFDATLPSVAARLSRLACVRHVSAYDEKRCICRELAVARVKDTPEARAVIGRFAAQTISNENGALLVQLAETPKALDAFLEALRGAGEVDSARSGAITLEKEY
ncbi:MAG TPA: acetolactate synthase small subunit [Feifaniaceae bacterium]|nr:acetolactate synthase small subunit [Feifaniaceae bacterium]